MIARLRRLLRDAAGEKVSLVAASTGYRLDVASGVVDAERFETLLAEAGSTADPVQAANALQAALALWRGPALADLGDFEFVPRAAAALENRRLDAVEDLAASELSLGRFTAAITRLQPHLADHPYRERAWGHLMVALFRNGRQAEALRAYQEVRLRLRADLGVDPGPELRRLEEQILLHRLPDPTSATDHGADPRSRHRLPVPLSSFVGREEDKERIAGLLRGHRLVTVIGAGGVGKTRVVLEIARDRQDAFPDGVFFADLALTDDPDLIVPQVTAALGVSDLTRCAGGAGLIEELAAWVDARRILLVLDNCEHLAPALAQVVAELLPRTAAMVVLATSRERLGIAGEHVWRLLPLPVPPESDSSREHLTGDAARLFLDRARSFDPDLALGPDELSSIGRVCRRLDGIPLALELAAARLRVMTASELADRLDGDLGVLAGGPATAPTRHRTMRACLDWGYDLLTEDERRLLRMLSVFVGGADLTAIEASAPTDANEVLETLTRLIDMSWVSVEVGRDGARFRLPETVRRYAAEQLREAGEEESAALRHRDHYLRLAASYRGAPLCVPRVWLIRVSADYENIRAALAWSCRREDHEQGTALAGHLISYWALDGRFAEGRDWLERVLRIVPSPSAVSVERIWARVALGLLVGQLGETATCREIQEAAAAEAAVVGAESLAAYAVGYRAGFGLPAEGPATAEPLWRSARAAFAGTGDIDGLAWCDFNLAFVLLARDEHAAARACLEQALGVGRTKHSDVLFAHAAAALASLLALAEDRDRPPALATEALAAARRIGLRHVLVMALVRAAEVGLLCDDEPAASACLVEALHTLATLGGRLWVDDAVQLIGVLLQRRGAMVPAVRLIAAGAGAAAGTAEGAHRPLRILVERAREAAGSALDEDTRRRQCDLGAELSSATALDEALQALLATAR